MGNEIYNSSNWGTGVCDNTIDWGIVYKDDASCTPSFTNTKSVNFDAVDDQVNLPDIPFLKGGGSYFSLSTWINVKGGTQNGFWSCRSATPDQMNLWRDTSNKLNFDILSSVAGNISVKTDASAISNDTWYNIIVIFNGTEVSPSDRLKVYIDGIAPAQTVTGTGTNLPQGGVTVLNYIGRTFSGIRINGNIDETAIWDNDQSANISTISATPLNDLSSFNPISWWRMGDGDVFPTLTDNGSGGNSGIMTNMDAGDIVNDVP